MREGERRSIILPILLIVAGLALLMEQLGVWRPDWGEIIRLWPALLILFGLELIARGRRASGPIVGLLVVGVLVVVVSMAWPAITAGRRMETRTLTVPALNIDEAGIDIALGSAAIDLRAGEPGSPLLVARVSHVPGRSDPRLETQTRLRRAEVRLDSEQRGLWLPLGSGRQETWDVTIRPAFPVALTLALGVGNAGMDLQGLSLTRLDVRGGIGEHDITLSERGAYAVQINGGIGNIRLTVPEGVAARVRVDEGLGSVEVDERFEREGRYYLTAGYEQVTERIDIDIDGGIGSIHVQ